MKTGCRDHGRGNQQVYGWHRGIGMWWLQGPVPISWTPASGCLCQHKYRNSGFPMGCAEAAAADGRCGSNVHEVNTWQWQFERGKPRLGGQKIVETFNGKENASKALDKRRKEASGSHKGDWK
jgi:hypothetical protein